MDTREYICEHPSNELCVLRSPLKYWNQKLPNKLPPLKEPIHLTSLPLPGYLEQVPWHDFLWLYSTRVQRSIINDLVVSFVGQPENCVLTFSNKFSCPFLCNTFRSRLLVKFKWRIVFLNIGEYTPPPYFPSQRPVQCGLSFGKKLPWVAYCVLDIYLHYD